MDNERSTDDGKREPVPRPDAYIDHEARCRPADNAGALADPQHADEHSDAADKKQRGFHGVLRCSRRYHSMKPHRAYGLFGSVSRRLLLGGAALSALVAGSTAGSAPDILPDFGTTENIPLWPGTPPGGEGIDLSLRIA